jgi:hypothetical protein
LQPLQPERAISELPSSAGAHCRQAFNGKLLQTTSLLDSLPYHDLGGTGLERLCFGLILASGYRAPRFFGKTGQTDYGVDLVASQGGRITVWQCKNLSLEPNARQIESWLSEFEATWLAQQDLPKPIQYVLCCPHPLRGLQVSEAWLTLEQQFRSRAGIEIALWHKDLLDELLRNRPDLVADSFSERHAEQFCHMDDWRSDVFWPLSANSPHPRELDRYFERRASDRLHVDDDQIEQIRATFDSGSITLLRGPRGAGKTFTALTFTAQLEETGWRGYYINLSKSAASDSELALGIRRRLSRPTVFIFDNCHAHLDLVEGAIRRLGATQNNPHIKIICVARWSQSDEPRADYHSFVDEDLKQGDRILSLSNTRKMHHELIRALRQDLTLTDSMCEKLSELCAHDLYLVDDVLDQFDGDIDLELVDKEELFRAIRIRYFGAPVVVLPNIRRLTAVAQCELSPHPRLFEGSLLPSERQLLSDLVTVAGTPPGYHFPQSSAAEAAFWALCLGDGILLEQDIVERAALDIIEVLSEEASNCKTKAEADAWFRNLTTILQSSLIHISTGGQLTLKSMVVVAEPIRAMLLSVRVDHQAIQVLGRALRVLRKTGHLFIRELQEKLSNSLEILITNAPQLSTLILSIRTLAILNEVDRIEKTRIVERIGASRWVALVKSYGTINELLGLCRIIEPELARRALSLLSESSIHDLVDATIEGQRPLRALGRVLRGFRSEIANMPILEELENQNWN